MIAKFIEARTWDMLQNIQLHQLQQKIYFVTLKQPVLKNPFKYIFELICLVKCPLQRGQETFEKSLEQYKDQQPLTPSVKAFESIPGPMGLPIVGTLLDYMKKDGPAFNKLFEVTFVIGDNLVTEHTF